MIDGYGMHSALKKLYSRSVNIDINKSIFLNILVFNSFKGLNLTKTAIFKLMNK